MTTEEDKIFCNNLAIKCIGLEKEIVDYVRSKSYDMEGYVETELSKITNEFNKIAIILKKISQNPSEE